MSFFTGEMQMPFLSTNQNSQLGSEGLIDIDFYRRQDGRPVAQPTVPAQRQWRRARPWHVLQTMYTVLLVNRLSSHSSVSVVWHNKLFV